MIFSAQLQQSTRQKFDALLAKAGDEAGSPIRTRLQPLSPDVSLAVQWLYANSPLSDLANYDFDLFCACAEHGVFLRTQSPLARDLPEELFLHYVLHSRVNEEELCDCRSFFHGLLADRIRGLSPRAAVIEANYWCAEQVTYQSTDSRTISALGAYRSAYGRCGEESTFAVNVLRAIGIPARQIYTPRWAHCDDNHAWVEVWVEGCWHFLGACEPEELLDRGWFTGAASRAMLIHSRRFGEGSGEEVASRSGMVCFLNHTGRYARTKRLAVAVKDPSGAPVEGAQVSFQLLNGSRFFPAAVLTTGADGLAALTCGLGTLGVHVKKGDLFCERLVFTPDVDVLEICLRREEPVYDVWEDFVSIAPRDQGVPGVRPTEEQKALALQKTAAANEKREQRVAGMWDARRAQALVEKHGYSQKVLSLLRESRGNLDRLMDFLADGSYPDRAKEALLLTLSAKDWRDVDPEVLREVLETSGDPGGQPELFYRYIACPRVFNEPLRPSRRFLQRRFSEEQKARFRADPPGVWAYIQENIRFDPALEYGQIVTLPAGALTVGHASPLSRKILFVSICRALGIAARMNPVNREAEYYANGRFLPVEAPEGPGGTIVLEKEPGESWQYGADFALARLAEGAYQPLSLYQEAWEGERLVLPAAAGVCRIITDNRLPNGDLHASKYSLLLQAGETRRIKLRKYPAVLAEMLDNFSLDDFKVLDRDGGTVRGRDLTRSPAVLLWLEEGKEPTEHILNEMLEMEEAFRSLPAEILFLVRGPEALRNPKLQKVLDTFGRIRVYYDSFAPNVETLARRMYVDPEKLPLILITTSELNAVYACSGYNVGSGEMIVKICRQGV